MPCFEINKSKIFPTILIKMIGLPNFIWQLNQLTQGVGRVRIKESMMLSLSLILPPLKEQKIIVKKTKDIETEESDLKQEIAQQQTLLKKLRQQILQEAIEGKLTQDWRKKNPNTEPASELLKRIQAEKQQLIKDKKIKAQKTLPVISENEKPFKLPKSWAWCRLGEVVEKYEAGKSFKCINREIDNSEWGVIKTSAITSAFFKQMEHKYYQKHTPIDASKQIKNGDLIFCRASGTKGYAGKCCLVVGSVKNLLLSDKTPRLTFSCLIEKKYIYFHNESKHTVEYYFSLNTGKSTSMNNITKDQLFENFLPLPPPAEQKAIVAKVEKLLNICDKLQTQITANQTYAEQLMQAVLKAAFTQAEQPI
ncbi:Type I restriction-modification system, specificity subunit S [hydrothermal vent metagenome]|uniref:Type I restriction-modification system, specificity subunit S n=1 Tax=hydrothermal vent metagenome TaxID=652676 RepID=A0A1W1E3K3_9ZZZZ